MKVKAIDVVPYEYGIWCSIDKGEPFCNPIVERKWSEDGKKAWFMLESHNFTSAMPDEEIEVMRLDETHYRPKKHEKLLPWESYDQMDTRSFVAARPTLTCRGRGTVTCVEEGIEK